MGSQSTMLSLLLCSFITSVLGHGGMVWPPSWQDGKHLSIEEVSGKWISSDPPVVDPNTGKKINNINSWLTDQAYIGGHGTDEFLGGNGTVTNFEEGYCDKACQDAGPPGQHPGSHPPSGEDAACSEATHMAATPANGWKKKRNG